MPKSNAQAQAPVVTKAQAAAKEAKKAAPKKQTAEVMPFKPTRIPAGAAGGAAEQSHTKRALMQWRKREADEAAADGMIAAKDVAGNKLWVDPADPWLVDGVKYHNASRAGEARRAAEEDAKLAAAGKPPKPVKAEAKPKAAPKAKEAKAEADRKITILDKKYVYGGEGSLRRASWDACKASKTTAEYKAKGGAAKYLSRFEAAGAIKLG